MTKIFQLLVPSNSHLWYTWIAPVCSARRLNEPFFWTKIFLRLVQDPPAKFGFCAWFSSKFPPVFVSKLPRNRFLFCCDAFLKTSLECSPFLNKFGHPWFCGNILIATFPPRNCFPIKISLKKGLTREKVIQQNNIHLWNLKKKSKKQQEHSRLLIEINGK